MRYSSLAQWLQWLEGLHPKTIELGLERIRTVARRLNLLNPDIRIITVAGTNGKGSCLAMLQRILMAAGARVGTYTSPHLLQYQERISIQGQPVDEISLCQSFEAIDQARKEISLTYFEFGTLAAVDLFIKAEVDVMLLEVGLGGRLDAVNLWDADIAVITSIALDHQEYLGNSREAIGREKAGVFRKERLAICADINPPASIQETAASTGARLLQMGKDFHLDQAGADTFSCQLKAQFIDADGKWTYSDTSIHSDNSKHLLPLQCNDLELDHLPCPSLPLPSIMAALQVAFSLGIDLRHIYPPLTEQLKTVDLSGRAQRLSYRGLELILDVAHNPAASAYLADKLANEALSENSVSTKPVAIVGMMKDKDRINTLRPLIPAIEAWYVVNLHSAPRSANAAELQQDLKSLDVSSVMCDSVSDALNRLTDELPPGRSVLVFGSFLTVAATLLVCQDDSACQGNKQAE